MRAAVTFLLATGILPRASTIPLDWEQEGLSCAAFDIRNTDRTTNEFNLASTIAQVVTRKGNRGCFTIFRHPKSRDNLHLRRHQERCQSQHVRHHIHGPERETKGTGAHRNMFLHSRDRHVGPRVARTTELMQRKYHWTLLKSDVRDYVLSCGCRRLNISTSQRVAMLPAPLPPTLGSSRDGHPRQGSEVGSWEQTCPYCSGQSQQIPVRLSTTQQDRGE